MFKLDLGKQDEVKHNEEVKITEGKKKEEEKSLFSPRTARSEISEIKTDTAALDSARTDTTRPDSARSEKSVEDEPSLSYSYSESSRSEARSKTYSEDYSASSRSKTESTSASSSSRSTITHSVSKPEPAAKPGFEPFSILLYCISL